MKATAITFTGSCSNCGHAPYHRGGVDINFDVTGHYLCLRCARRLANAIKRAANYCARKVLRGYTMRHGKWVKRPRKPKEK